MNAFRVRILTFLIRLTCNHSNWLPVYSQRNSDPSVAGAHTMSGRYCANCGKIEANKRIKTK